MSDLGVEMSDLSVVARREAERRREEQAPAQINPISFAPPHLMLPSNLLQQMNSAIDVFNQPEYDTMLDLMDEQTVNARLGVQHLELSKLFDVARELKGGKTLKPAQIDLISDSITGTKLMKNMPQGVSPEDNAIADYFNIWRHDMKVCQDWLQSDGQRRLSDNQTDLA